MSKLNSPMTRHMLIISPLCSAVICASSILAHDHSARKFERSRRVALAQAAAQAVDTSSGDVERPTCRLKINLVAAKTKQPFAGLVRVTDVASGKAVKLSDHIHRELNWYAISRGTTVSVPQTKLKIEAFHGIETALSVMEKNLAGMPRATVQLMLQRIYDPRAEGLRNGNTHLHLRKLTHAEAYRYLRDVPRADGLDLVFLSHLRRLPEERYYISNQILEESLAGGGGELKRLSQHGVLFGNGEEHRHNFGGGG